MKESNGKGKNNMEVSVIGLFGTIIGALIVGVPAYFQNKQTIDYKRIENKKELLLVKYENMSKDLNNYLKYSQEISLLTIQSKDIRELKTNLNSNDFIMHSKFYAPQLSQQTDELTKKLGLIIISLSDLITSNYGDKEDLISKVVKCSWDFEDKVRNIQKELMRPLHNS